MEAYEALARLIEQGADNGWGSWRDVPASEFHAVCEQIARGRGFTASAITGEALDTLQRLAAEYFSLMGDRRAPAGGQMMRLAAVGLAVVAAFKSRAASLFEAGVEALVLEREEAEQNPLDPEFEYMPEPRSALP